MQLVIVAQALFQSFLARHRQFFSALGSAAGQNFSAVGGSHALAEAVHCFTAALMWLEGPFHCFFFSASKLGYISCLQSPYCCL
jgi:hypothetical protein